MNPTPPNSLYIWADFVLIHTRIWWASGLRGNSYIYDVKNSGLISTDAQIYEDNNTKSEDIVETESAKNVLFPLMWGCAEGTALPESTKHEDLRQKEHQWSSGYGGDVRSLAATYTPKILLSPQNPGAELSGPVNDTGNIIVDGPASLSDLFR